MNLRVYFNFQYFWIKYFKCYEKMDQFLYFSIFLGVFCKNFKFGMSTTRFANERLNINNNMFHIFNKCLVLFNFFPILRYYTTLFFFFLSFILFKTRFQSIKVSYFYLFLRNNEKIVRLIFTWFQTYANIYSFSELFRVFDKRKAKFFQTKKKKKMKIFDNITI